MVERLRGGRERDRGKRKGDGVEKGRGEMEYRKGEGIWKGRWD